jgi:hypothetical protein
LSEWNVGEEITPVAKVFGQNICWFFSHIKATDESHKPLVRLRMFRSFRIWAQKFCVGFCSRGTKESLKGLNKQFGRNGWAEVSGRNVSSFLAC